MSGSRKRPTAAKPRKKPAAAQALPPPIAPSEAPPAAAFITTAAPAPAPAPVELVPVALVPVALGPVPVGPPGLAHLPMPLLAMPMGIGGVGLAWREAAPLLGAPAVIGEALLLVTALVWLLVVVLHALRAIRHPDALLADLRHPVRVSFAAAPTIGLMILSSALWAYAPGFGAALWCIAVPLHLLVAMMIMRRLIIGRGSVAMLVPPLMIPLVGNILAPVFGVRMGYPDASWMMFGVGLLLWLMIKPVLLYRVIAGPPLLPTQQPSLAIFLAPPAVAALALVGLIGEAGGVTLALTGLALLVAAVLISLAGDFARGPFTLAHWSFTFPSAAFAGLLMAEGFSPILCWLALLFSTALTAWVSWRSWGLARDGVFARPEA